MAKKEEINEAFTERMLVETLNVIEQAQLHMSALDHAGRFVNAHNRLMGRTLDYTELRRGLIEIENNEWRKLFMWGLIATPKLRERVKAAARDRFLAGRSEVLEYLSPDHIRPSSWLVEEEEQFRAMVERVFGIKPDAVE